MENAKVVAMFNDLLSSFSKARKIKWPSFFWGSWGHPTTVFCKISVRRSEDCLEFSIT